MMKLQTFVDCGRSTAGVSYANRTMVVGSCFADEIGSRMIDAGFDAMVNPFGTLYNPVSISNSLGRLASGVPFAEGECVEMGAGAGLVCSWSHHTSFARPAGKEFLDNANKSLSEASAFFAGCDRVVVTLGTSWCFRLNSSGETVSNCLKRPSAEFTRYRLSLREEELILGRMVERFPDKKFIFTVSPVRHLSDGAHGNALSKCQLLLAVDAVCAQHPDRAEYFPAYEIVMDELRDYRFYAEDMVHPSSQTSGYVWERFMDWALPESERTKLADAERAFRRSQHRPMH